MSLEKIDKVKEARDAAKRSGGICPFCESLRTTGNTVGFTCGTVPKQPFFGFPRFGRTLLCIAREKELR